MIKLKSIFMNFKIIKNNYFKINNKKEKK